MNAPRGTEPSQPPDPTERRNYWRSIVAGTCMRHAFLLQIIPREGSDMRSLPQPCREVAVAKCQLLIDWACSARAASDAQKRGHSIEQCINADLWESLKAFQPADSVPVSQRVGQSGTLC